MECRRRVRFVGNADEPTEGQQDASGTEEIYTIPEDDNWTQETQDDSYDQADTTGAAEQWDQDWYNGDWDQQQAAEEQWVDDGTQEEPYIFDVAAVAVAAVHSHDRVLIDSGAEVCICPTNYMKRVPIYKLPERFPAPKLQSVQGHAIKCVGPST